MHVRFSLAILLVFAMISPTAAFALGDGKKHFKTGMKHEVAEQWDQAAEAFALAVAENPKNPEYRLHLQRALFNASQMYMKKGNLAANEKDYEGAFIAFRKAYAYDPVNELAKSEMARMVRLQQELLDNNGKPAKPGTDDGKVKLVQTSYNAPQPGRNGGVPQKLEQIRQVPFPGGVNLQFIVKELAKDLDLNVLFDAESRLETRTVRIDLKNVTSAKALDYIFLQENLFFQKVGPRTILVATGLRRVNFQQLVLRTFYLANAAPKDVKAIITAAIPAQPGRSQTIVLEDTSTNSITVRDTQENIQLISKLIQSLDKDRAEVVMDVAIYEVNKTDLLEFGNQIGTSGQLRNLGGSSSAVVGLGGNPILKTLTGTTDVLARAFGVGLVIPSANLVALQQKDNTKLIASTQIHAFNNEDSSARIGQRVPVRTASFAPINNGGNGQGNNNFLGDVYNYEQVGLTLKFKPIVFPNQDVQVQMDIESKDVAGALTEQPVFTERKITGTARVQNNKTLLLASVAQNTESNGRQGLPILGLIPIIGHLFSAPKKNNRQVDIVIAITPRVIRAPAITPEDEIERPTGSLQTPTTGSLEAMVIQEEKDELLALARRNPTNVEVQLPDQAAEAPAYVRSTTSANAGQEPTKVPETTTAANTTANPAATANGLSLQPIDSGVKTLEIKETADTSGAAKTETPSTSTAAPVQTLPVPEEPTADAAGKPVSELVLPASLPELKRGEKVKIPVSVSGTTLFRSAVLGLRYDAKKLAIRSITMGDIFGAEALKTTVAPFINNDGKMFVSLSLPSGNVVSPSGVIAMVEVEALADGRVELAFEKDVISFIAPDGKNVALRF